MLKVITAVGKTPVVLVCVTVPGAVVAAVVMAVVLVAGTTGAN